MGVFTGNQFIMLLGDAINFLNLRLFKRSKDLWILMVLFFIFREGTHKIKESAEQFACDQTIKEIEMNQPKSTVP